MVDVVDMVARAIEKAGSQVRLAGRLEVSQATVSRWLHRETRPRAEHVEPLARLIGCDPMAVLGAFRGAKHVEFIDPSNWVRRQSGARVCTACAEHYSRFGRD
jgi:hypothetical protein